MSEPNIIVITDASDPRLEALVPMFEDLHDVMHSFGMMQQLAPNGARLWSKVCVRDWSVSIAWWSPSKGRK